MCGQAAKVFLTEAIYNILSEFSKRRTLSGFLLQRVKIILLAFENKTTQRSPGGSDWNAIASVAGESDGANPLMRCWRSK